VNKLGLCICCVGEYTVPFVGFIGYTLYEHILNVLTHILSFVPSYPDNSFRHSLTHGLRQLRSCNWRCTRNW